MKKTKSFYFIFLINTIFINSFFGQTKTFCKSYDQKKIEKNKVYENIYNLRWCKNKLVSNGDTIAYLVDDRNYKGVINYGVEFHSKDFRLFNFIEDVSMYYLNVEFTKCNFTSDDSIIEIEGFVTGGWGDELQTGGRKSKNNIDIFIGEKKDTITKYYFGDVINKDNVEVKFKNKIVNDHVALDSFPAFYFKNCPHYRTSARGRRAFKIRGKVTKNTLLAFAGYNCYSEIFDIGCMVFFPKKNNAKSIKEKIKTNYKPILIKNRLVSDIEKEKLKPKEINYYTHTEKAENYILRNQFAKAKEEYNLLNLNYPSVYARDINNAIRCAILSRDLKTAFIWGKKLAYKGVGISYFNSKIFNPLRKSIDWKNFSRQYDSIYNLNKKKINSNLKAQIEQLLNEDQANYGLENRKEPQVLYETTERVTDKLIELLKKEGYPSEEKIGVYTKNDTILIQSPDYNVILRHAVQQKPKGLSILLELLDKSAEMLEYDKERSSNHKNFPSACYHIYKGNLYKNNSCPNVSLTENKIKFMFKNPYNFIIDFGDFIITEYDKEHPEEYDKYYEENYILIMKLTNDWEFYDKN